MWLARLSLLPRRAAGVLLCLMLVLWVGQARAANAQRAERERAPETVGIVLAGGDLRTQAALTTAFRHSLDKSGVSVVVSTVPRMRAAEVAAPNQTWPGRVNIWVNLGTAKTATVYVTEGRNVFTRRLLLGRDFDPIALDLLDVVVTSAVEAILAGKELGVSREEFQRSLDLAGDLDADGGPVPAPPSAAETTSPKDAEITTPPPRAPPPTPSARSPAPEPPHTLVSLGAIYEGGLVATTQGVHGPGLLFDGERDRWRIGAAAAGHFPYDVSRGGVTVRSTTGALRFSVARLFFFRPTLVASGGIGVGADLTRVRPVATDTSVAPAPPFWALDPAVRPFIGLESRQGRMRIGVVAGVDVDLVAPRYLVATTSTPGGAPASRSQWVPWRWRPYVALMIGFFL